MKQENSFTFYLSLLEKGISILPDKSEENAYNTLCALWLTASGKRISPILAEKLELPELSDSQILLLEEFVQSRLAGIPLAHLTERQNFMGLDYILDKGLYIPRKETELLTQTAIDTVLSGYTKDDTVSVIDLCTGIGTIALAIAYYCKNTHVFGSDIYAPAIIAAEKNAKHFSLDKRASFFNADLFEPFEPLSLKGNTDIIVCAPPYISSAKVKNMASEIADHEPVEAFDAGPFGLSIFNNFIANSPEYLAVNGFLIFECGLGQGEFLANRIDGNEHYGPVVKICDENNNIRVLKTQKIA